MLRIGLTGNIGSGKTLVSRIFNTLGIGVFNADIETKNLYFENTIKDDLCKMFGHNILNNNNIVDLKKLGNIVFNDKSKLAELTSYIHPKVVSKYDAWTKTQIGKPFCIHESAIIFEYSLENKFDKIICVSAPYGLRLQRVLKRDKSKRPEVEIKMKNQLDEKIKVVKSDYVIINDGKEFIIPQVVEIHKHLINLV